LITVSIGVSKLVWNRPDFYQCSMMHTCHEVLLIQKLLHVMHEICGKFFILQQFSVPAIVAQFFDSQCILYVCNRATSFDGVVPSGSLPLYF